LRTHASTIPKRKSGRFCAPI